MFAASSASKPIRPSDHSGEQKRQTRSSWSRVIEEMVGGQHRIDEGKRAEQVRVTQKNGSNRERQTQFVCQCRSVLELID
jgi:hypothetical protein